MLDRVTPQPQRRYRWTTAELTILIALRAQRVPTKVIARELRLKTAGRAMACPIRTPASIATKISKLEATGSRRQKLSERISFCVAGPVADRAAACRVSRDSKAMFYRRCLELGLAAIEAEIKHPSVAVQQPPAGHA